MIYFTSDTHFGHSNIIKYCNRPYINIQEHDEDLLLRWNNVVSKRDEVYHLGDFGMGDPKRCYEFSKRLNGRIHLIIGNHDKRCTLKEPLRKRFETIQDVKLLTFQEKGSTYRVFLSHYAHRVWASSHYGTYHFYGHSHGNLPGLGNSIDVGIDSWDYFPVPIEKVLNSIERNKRHDPDIIDIDSEEF